MVTPLEIIRPTGKNVTRPKQGGGGMALINAVLCDRYTEALAVAHKCESNRLEFEWQSLPTFLPSLRNELGARLVKPTHARCLPDFARADAAADAFCSMLVMPPEVPLSQPMAIEMLSVLYGTLSKRKKDEDETAMLACAELFNPVNNVIGESTGLWEPVSTRPIVLALAVKARIAKSPFVAASELREEMRKVEYKLHTLYHNVKKWLELMRKADEILFEYDRAAWDAAYARVGRDVVRAMLGMEDGWENECDDGEESPLLPYWRALDDLLKAKKPPPQHIAAAPKPPPERKRIAAAPKPPKRIAAARKRSETKRAKPKQEVKSALM